MNMRKSKRRVALKVLVRLWDITLIILALWFAASYIEVIAHNTSAMGADYASSWNLFAIAIK